MSRESSALRHITRNASKHPQSEANENEFENSLNSVQFPPPRTPLNTISDPSQYQKESQGLDFNSKDKFDNRRTGQSSDRKIEDVDVSNLLQLSKGVGFGIVGSNCGTPRVSGRGVKSHSEPNSAQNTPARSVSKTLSVGAMGACTGSRPPQYNGGRGMSSSRVSRGISMVTPEPKVELPYFELEEDPSFWNDHNVQVLVRIRPMNTSEKVIHGYGRCLRQESSQTLLWLGHPETRFTFDHVACETISQEKLFRVAGLPMVENCMSGYNSCMFAYGQTGSGKTYTMMGEIYEMEGKLNEDCGITPRIFEYLFTRISVEEENRGDEKLKYSCKCSFLEIYNEQITDLLEPSSTNLQLREDLKKGVYVENLTECNVRTVSDVVKLLLVGAANRKMAATHMNSESSRSHSVFTCIIESRWEKDSMTHFRFARLNLVDLAGSERQKSSGAEGDRLKEAANINKSLSTLGLVIMSLVDLAHGKQRHVPYRDSRLTFLLQDSLGGNSKTMIVANVSPSISSVNETLSTLKFAQRAKLIQNNAKVNEDASGDVFALQQQIQQLKGQLSCLLKHHNLSRSSSCHMLCSEEFTLADYPEEFDTTEEGSMTDDHKTHNVQKKVESILVSSDCGDEMVSYNQADDGVTETDNVQKMDENFDMQLHETRKELRDARLLIEAMEAEQLHLIEELRLLQEENRRYKEAFSSMTDVERQSVSNDGRSWLDSGALGAPRNQNNALATESNEDIMRIALQAKLDRMSKDLEEARLLNKQYQEDQTSNICDRHQVELDFEHVEMETTKTILHLQEEVAGLQLELQESVCSITQENTRLRETVAAKDDEIRAICLEWERATTELTNFLLDGSRSLKDVSSQIEGIACSFPQVNVWLGEQVERAAKLCIEKEETILLLQKSLEEAQNMVKKMELKLSSLKIATMALDGEVQQRENEENNKQPLQLSTQLDEKNHMIYFLEKKLKYKEDQVIEAEKRPNAAFMVVKRLSDCNSVAVGPDLERHIDTSKLGIPTKGTHQKFETKTGVDAFFLKDIEVQVELAKLEILESKNAINLSYADAETYLTSHQIDIHRVSSAYREVVQDLVRDIHEMRKNVMEVKENHTKFQFNATDSSLLEPYHSPMLENQYSILHKVRSELAETNGRLIIIKDCINALPNVHACPVMAENIASADGWSTDCSTSGSEFSTMSVASQNKVDMSSSTCCTRWPGEISEGKVGLEFEGVSALPASNQVSEKHKTLFKSSTHNKATILCLKKEMEMALNAFIELYDWLATFLNEKETGACSSKERRQVSSCMLWIKEAETGYHDTREFAADVNMEPASSFLTKIEEAHVVIKEADFMLNALLKANENAKHSAVMWRKTGEELIVERASLMKEVDQLKSMLCSKEKESEMLCDQFQCALVEVNHSMSLLQESYSHMKRDVEEWFSVTYSEVLSMAHDILCCIGNSRFSLEDFCSEMMEKGFASFVLYQCHLSKFCRKSQSLKLEPCLLPFRRQEYHPLCLSSKNDRIGIGKKSMKEGNENVEGTYLEEGDQYLTLDSLIFDTMSLKKELEKKEVLLKGLLFDFTLLQESASNTKDIKDESENLVLALRQVRHELQMKTCQLDDLLIQHRELKGRMSETETAAIVSNSELDQARETINMLSDRNTELRMVLKDLYLNKSEVEEQLEEQKEAVKSLEKEILRLTSPVKQKMLSSVEDIEDVLSRVTSERDQLLEEVYCLTDKLEMAHALADENEAVAVEARQESEASKIYAEQKEEEVKILERSVEELECTINVLEKKVYEMDEELERHQLIRDSLEHELQALRQRMQTVEKFTESVDADNIYVVQTHEQLSRELQNERVKLQEAHNYVRAVEEERAELDREIKQLKEYISELVLHADAQSSQYQQKYKTLEAMVREVKADSLNSTSTAPTIDKTEKSSTRARGSSSPFRCIASLVQQKNLEKDQELSMARLRLEELEALASSRQKEVCMLNSRLASTDSMTHDVIRDLLLVKLDMTNYANLIDQQQVQKLVEDAQQQTDEAIAKEQEILNLRQQISNLMEERESCILELNRREEDILAAQMAVEQLQERDQLLAAQNEMLKMDKKKLKRKVAELDEMAKRLFGAQDIQQRTQKPTKTKEENSMWRMGNADINKRLASSEKIISGVNEELAQYCQISGGPGGSHPHGRTAGHCLEMKYRMQKP